MRPSLIVALLATTVMLGGCYWLDPAHERYLRRSDFITLGAGNAVAHNKAVQTINPWPPEAANDNIAMDGERAYIAVRRYKDDNVKPPATTQLEPFSSGQGESEGGNVTNTP